MNYLNFEEYPDLYNNLLINSSFDTIINLLIVKPSLEEKIIQLLPTILEFNGMSVINHFQEPYIKDYYKLSDHNDEDINFHMYQYDLSLPNAHLYITFYNKLDDFVQQLLDLNKHNIVNHIINIINTYDSFYYLHIIKNYIRTNQLSTYFNILTMYDFNFKEFKRVLFHNLDSGINNYYFLSELIKFSLYDYNLKEFMKIMLNDTSYFRRYLTNLETYELRRLSSNIMNQ
jgi:hypothetical protein